MRPRWIALAAIWFYWSSLFWLRPLFRTLGIRLADYPVLQSTLIVYDWPLRYLSSWMPRLFGRSVLNARLLAGMVGAAICLAVWALLVTRSRTRRTMAGRG